jgi:hypothetical protein
MADRQTIIAGDDGDVWEIGLITSAPGEPVELAALDGTFSCFLSVKGAVPPIYREIVVKNEDNTRFLAWLTPAETLALGKGTWLVGLELRNPTLVPPLVRETHRPVVIREAIVAPAP